MEITDVNTLFGAYPAQHADSSAETLTEAMGAQGVDWCLTLSTRGLFSLPADGNAETMRACRSHDHLIPVATLNPAHFWGQDGVVDALAGEAFEMVRFFPDTQGWPLEFAPFLALTQQIGKLPKMPIMVQTPRRGEATSLLRLLDGFPHPIILEGISPDTLTEAVVLMRTHDNLYLETHALQAPHSLPLIRDTVGIGRALFGSDAPGRSLASALSYVRASGLSAAEQEAVLAGNAQKIWQGGGD